MIEEKYNGGGKLKYYYDIYGNTTIEELYEKSKVTSINTYQYLYDTVGNWIKKTEFVNSCLNSTIERKITYY